MRRSTADLEAESRNRKNKKPNKLRTVLGVFAAILVIYIVAAIIVTVNDGVSTTVALNGTVSENVRTSGYVYKSQEVINAPSGGFLKCMVSEGERVKKDQVIAYIFAVEPDSALVQNIKDVHRLLRIKSGEVTEATYIDDGYSTTGMISQRIRNISDLRSERNLHVIKNQKEALDDVINKFNNESDINKSVDELNGDLSKLLAQAGGGIKIVAPVAGVFSARIDGFEDKLNVESVNNLTPSDVEELDKIKAYEQSEIITGQPLCKIVNNYNFSYAATVDEKEIENIKIGQSVEIEFFDLSQESVSGNIMRISDADGGEKVIVLSTNKYVEGIYSTSRTGADIVLNRAEGIKLPSKCIHVLDGATGVYVVRLDKAVFVPVNVKYRNDDWVVVSAAEPELGGEKLRIYDEVIVSGKHIEDNQVVR